LTGASPVESDFRLGQAISRTGGLVRRNFPAFFLISALPNVLLSAAHLHVVGSGWGFVLSIVGMVLATLSQAVVLRSAFQDLQGLHADLAGSMRIVARRFLPIVGVVFVVTVLGVIGIAAFILPGLFAFTTFFVASPACVVERLGVLSSMGRSANLTEGNRWKVFALLLMIFISDAIAEVTIDEVFATMTGAALAAHVIWSGIWGAFAAVLSVVTYHDLRVGKEGLDTRTLTAVFS
jgi:hypothetical protein